MKSDKFIAFAIIFSLTALLFFCWFMFKPNDTDVGTENKKLITLDSLCVIISDSADNQRTGGGKDFIRFKKDGLIGFCDSNRNVLIQPSFVEAGPFNEGISAIKHFNQYGYIDYQGYLDQEPLYEYAGTFRNGLAKVRIGHGRHGYGFFDRNFYLVIQDTLFWADEFSEGYCLVKDSLGKYAYIDTKGHLVTQYQFDTARKFKNGTALAKQGDEWFIIDKDIKITKLEKNNRR